jgi:hypothetical protein
VADEVLQFTCTIPAGTAKSAPVTIPMSMQLWDVESIDLEVPSGPSGLMGFYLAIGTEQWLPHRAGEWFVWNDRSKNWPLTNQPTSYGWNLVGYNTGKYAHSVTVGFHVNIITDDTSAVVAPTLTIVSQPVASGTTVL